MRTANTSPMSNLHCRALGRRHKQRPVLCAYALEIDAKSYHCVGSHGLGAVAHVLKDLSVHIVYDFLIGARTSPEDVPYGGEKVTHDIDRSHVPHHDRAEVLLD